jgi:predicted dehydrogenase
MKTAMVGLRHGHMGKIGPDHSGYIGTFRQLEDVEIVAYCEDTEPALLEPVCQLDPGARTYTSVDELIREEDFELAVVVLPAAEVPAAGIKLAEAGKHMYLEKQFARRSGELAELVRAVRRNGVVAMPGYPHRFNPVCRELKQLIDDDLLGRPLDIEVRLVTTQVRPGLRDPQSFLFTDAGEGGGVLHMLGCHYLEVMRYLMGCEIKSVQAMVGRPVGFIDEPLEDVALVAMEYENGAFGTMHAGYLQTARSEYDQTLVFRGTEGEAHWTPMGGPALMARSTRDSWKDAPERTIHHRLEPGPAGYANSTWMFNWMQNFVYRARDARDPELTMVDALRVLQSIDAIYESANSGRRVTVDYSN